jgi:hypothetical protein
MAGSYRACCHAGACEYVWVSVSVREEGAGERVREGGICPQSHRVRTGCGAEDEQDCARARGG